jgi:hypothetical protein
MNSTVAPKSFSVLELAAGSAALAVIALIAFVGLPVPRLQVSLPAEPRGGSQVLEPGGAKTQSSSSVDRLFTAEVERLGWSRTEDAAGLGQRFVEEGLLWEFAVDATSSGSRDARRDIALAAGLPEVSERTQGRPFATASDPSATANRIESSAPNQASEALIAPALRITQDSPTPGIRAENTFIGGWAENIGECQQSQHDGAPLVIGLHAAKTASSECDFRSVAQTATSQWRVVARCFSEGDSWNAHIDLRLAGSNLTWSSERGTATYVRCISPQYRHDRVAGRRSPL